MEPTTAPTPSVTPALPGRPTLRTDAAREHLCSLIRHGGLSDNAAATAAGLHRSTLWRWKQVEEDLDLTLAQAREQFREIQLNKILSGAKNWRAAAWLLQHVFPADYHPRAQERLRFQEAQSSSSSSSSSSSCPETVEITQDPRCKTPEIPALFSDHTLQNPAPPAKPASSSSSSSSSSSCPESIATTQDQRCKTPRIDEPASDPALQNPEPLNSQPQTPQNPVIPSETPLQNLRPTRRLSRKARRALERNQHRAAMEGSASSLP